MFHALLVMSAADLSLVLSCNADDSNIINLDCNSNMGIVLRI